MQIKNIKIYLLEMVLELISTFIDRHYYYGALLLGVAMLVSNNCPLISAQVVVVFWPLPGHYHSNTMTAVLGLAFTTHEFKKS